MAATPKPVIQGRRPLPNRSIRVCVDESLTRYIPLAKAAARKVYQSLPSQSGVEFSDLLQAGLLGLVRATRSYDPRVRCSFSTYATHRIRGEILDSLRRSDDASRTVRRWEREIAVANHQLCGTLQRRPSEEELRRHLGLDHRQWEDRRVSLWNVGHVALSTERDPAQASHEIVAPVHDQPDAVAARQELEEVVHLAVSKLPVRTQTILQLYYSDGLSMKQIGNIFRVNESRISQIHKRALRDVERTLRAKGIDSAEEW